MTTTLSIICRVLIIYVFTILASHNLLAQQKGEFIEASIGLGISAPYEFDESADESANSGFYLQGEYVLGLRKWLAIRPYAGFIFTSPSKEEVRYEATSRAFLLGGKARLIAPIPYVAPYFELGIGLSAGAFTTTTPTRTIEKNGVLIHIPVTLGLALGKENNTAIEFTYYFHPAVEQFSGAFAIGISFPINRKEDN